MSESNFLKKAHPHGWALFLFQSDLLHTMTLFFYCAAFCRCKSVIEESAVGNHNAIDLDKGCVCVFGEHRLSLRFCLGHSVLLNKNVFQIHILLVLFHCFYREIAKNKVFFVCENKVFFASLPPLLILYHKLSAKSIFRRKKNNTPYI